MYIYAYISVGRQICKQQVAVTDKRQSRLLNYHSLAVDEEAAGERVQRRLLRKEKYEEEKKRYTDIKRKKYY